MSDKSPLKGMCFSCKHIWVVAFLPMRLTAAARLMSSAICPMCACDIVVLHIEDSPEIPVMDTK